MFIVCTFMCVCVILLTTHDPWGFPIKMTAHLFFELLINRPWRMPAAWKDAETLTHTVIKLAVYILKPHCFNGVNGLSGHLSDH